jgi:hypothetical protein
MMSVKQTINQCINVIIMFQVHSQFLFIVCYQVWKSANGGRDWTLQTMKAPWKARTQHDATATYSQALGKAILYVANGIYESGQAANRNNDIWASSDDGVSWIRITANAAYRARQDGEVDSLNGILVITGGDIGTNNPGNINDIWASLDG